MKDITPTHPGGVGVSACALTRKQSKARNLLERFTNYKTEITRFATDFKVPFDNNQAERDSRNTKVKMKVSGGFRTSKGANAFARINSVLNSACKQQKMFSLYQINPP
jgi:transposase